MCTQQYWMHMDDDKIAFKPENRCKLRVTRKKRKKNNQFTQKYFACNELTEKAGTINRYLKKSCGM